ncbi:unnamed protein product [Spirodela intermedia]|uniref:Retrovirus-related Pol polyprotein from transposon TNT 1-94-like beta-barrel domain-containing protein n=1 Tax=Spirodela intermedia TaxID=51605 RepID=A0A7I8KRA2_SPIIN|nr:unnamed protein product [Spirodela intermedia]
MEQNCRESLFCSYCKKKRYTKENCWKLHGQSSCENNQPVNVKTSDELARIIKELEKLKVTLSSTHLARTGANSFSFRLYTHDHSHNGMWILDIGATDHMTPDQSKFITYTACALSEKVFTAGCGSLNVAEIGNLQIHNLGHSFFKKSSLSSSESPDQGDTPFEPNLGSITDQRSTIGYCSFIGGNLVTWRAKKIKSFIDIAHNSVQHDRTKHIEVDRHFIKEKIKEKIISTSHVRSTEQVIDILAKGLAGTSLQRITCKLDMDEAHEPT